MTTVRFGPPTLIKLGSRRGIITFIELHPLLWNRDPLPLRKPRHIFRIVPRAMADEYVRREARNHW